MLREKQNIDVLNANDNILLDVDSKKDDGTINITHLHIPEDSVEGVFSNLENVAMSDNVLLEPIYELDRQNHDDIFE